MPEYSTPKITPDETTKLPGMNGSSSGYVLTSELLDIIRSTYGQANGVASLDSSGKLPTAQLPDIADDVLVYASKALLPAQGVEAKIYITTDDNVLYRWDSTLGDYVQLSVDLSDYATLDDLAAEETARETADTNLNDAIAQHEARIENLEEAHGSYHEVDVKSVYTIPTGKGSNWLIDGLRGVSRVENNLVQNPSFETGVLSPWTIVGGNATVNNNKVVVTSASLCALYQSIQIQKGHIYLLAVDIDSNNTNITFGIYKDSSGYKVTTAFTGKKMLVLANIDGDVDGHNIDLRIRVNDSNSTTYTASNFIVKDLTDYFNGTIPSDADTIAKIQTNYPWLLTPSDYDAGSLVSTTYTAVKSIGFNRFDKTKITVNQYIMNDGNIGGSVGRACSDYMRIDFSKTYYLKSTAINNIYQVHYYDANKNWIGRALGSTSNTTFIPISGACFVRVNLLADDKDNVNFNVSDNSLNGQTFPYMESTLTFSSPVSLKSAGAVAEEYYPCVEVNGEYKSKSTHPLGSFNGTEMTFMRLTEQGLNLYKMVTGLTDIAMSGSQNIFNTFGLPVVSSFDSTTETNEVIQQPNNYGDIYILLKTTRTLADFDVNYELATATESYADPILDNLIPTEAGGTIESILTTPVDDSMTLGYINL